MLREFPKSYNPHEAEKKWYNKWIDDKIFHADNKSDKSGYSILLPPPNVTGILHFGHILNMTIQDLYIRRKRMTGNEVCWFPGTDHAGIATQTRVEKELHKSGMTKYDLGREGFINRVWEWKNQYGGIIFKQMENLGVSCDWERTIFTMDEGPTDSVTKVFVKLFDDGLIYKGKRIINWSPFSQTALSDDEVEFREVKEHLYTMRYYFEDKSGYICCATARPETIFGDIAVAVNPHDERYKSIIGKKVFVPLVNRLVEVIADDYADPAFGTGCVKITPAHDPNDFLVGERHNLEIINTINPDGTLNEITGEYNGIERFKARKIILDKLIELDLIEKTEEYIHNVGFSQRGGEPIEPYLSDQWFVKMKPLAEIALQPVLDGDIKFYPNHWVKTYEHWMNNIRDWCISRQLWWGHRIPVYYTEDGRYTAALNEHDARLKLNISDNEKLAQDTDVLDTWFSSWLWPMTTMGWKADSEEFSDDMMKFLPTDLLVTAPDIIFFWVARMIMASKYFVDTIPFKNVYFTSLIRDGLGRKLSKSLGNSPDPLNVIDKYGADAVRFTMVFLSPLGQDVRMDVNIETQDIPSVEIGRNFCNKIWNAFRFLMMKYDQVNSDIQIINSPLNEDELSISDKWILSRLHTTISSIDNALENYRVNDYSKILYDFIWRDFCDWYVEIVKIQLNNSENSEYKQRLMNFTINIFEDILKLLHPIMPFITEEIWHLIQDSENTKSISLNQNPILTEEMINLKIEAGFEIIQNITEEIRKIKNQSNIPPSQKLPLIISAKNPDDLEILNQAANVISSLTRSSEIETGCGLEKPKGAIAGLYREYEIFISAGSVIDVEAEKMKIKKEIERITGLITSTEKKLSNEKFIQNAAQEIVNKEKEKLESLRSQLEILNNNYDNL